MKNVEMINIIIFIIILCLQSYLSRNIAEISQAELLYLAGETQVDEKNGTYKRNENNMNDMIYVLNINNELINKMISI